ncbi:MAG: hypothetical protein R3F34_14155 [Planctomycetota bacterium]
MNTIRLSALSLLVTIVAAGSARADVVFAKAPAPTGGIEASAWMSPDGSDSDRYAWDDFTLEHTQTITEVRWRGGYSLNAQYGKVTDFRVSFFESIPGGSQPLITALPEHESQETVIKTFHTNNNAGETPVGTFGGKTMYEYRYVLPTPVTLQGGVKYWIRILGAQPGYPDWGMATSSNPGSHFKFTTGISMFQNWPHDLTFSLLSRWTDLGAGLAGAGGEPRLTGSGPLTPGTHVSFDVSGAAPGAPIWFAAGVNEWNLPFASGLLVPEPIFVVPGATDASGAASVGFTTGVPMAQNFRIVVQAWVLDTGAPEWLAATNAVSGAP